MYQRARKLHNLIPESTDVAVLAEEELEAYMVALNSLALIDRGSAWFSMPLVPENGHEVSFMYSSWQPSDTNISLESDASCLSISQKPNMPIPRMTWR